MNAKCLQTLTEAKMSRTGFFVVEICDNQGECDDCLPVLKKLTEMRLGTLVEGLSESISGVRVDFSFEPTPHYIHYQNFKSVEDAIFLLFNQLDTSQLENTKGLILTSIQEDIHFTYPILKVSVILVGEVSPEIQSALQEICDNGLREFCGGNTEMTTFSFENKDEFIYENQVSPKFLNTTKWSDDYNPAGSDALKSELDYMSYVNAHFFDTNEVADESFTVQSFDLFRGFAKEGT